MQFIPRLSSTSINNKHLHKTRAGLRGLRQHRPACSTSDETPCVLSPYWAMHLLSTRLVLSCWDPKAHSLLMPFRTYQSSSFITSDRDPSVLTVVAESTCGSWQETDALVWDSSAPLMCPRSFHQPMWLKSCTAFVTWPGARVGSWGSLWRMKSVFWHTDSVLNVNKGTEHNGFCVCRSHSQ